MGETNTVSPLRQRMIEDMAARKLNPHTQRPPGSNIRRIQRRPTGTAKANKYRPFSASDRAERGADSHHQHAGP